MLTHGNIASNIQCSLLGFNMRPGLISISFLPLCHITARHVDFAMLYHGVTLAYCPFHGPSAGEPAGGAAVHFRRRAAGLRKDLCAGGAESQRPAQAAPSSIGRFLSGTSHKPEILAGQDSHVAQLEAGQQAGVLEDSRRAWAEKSRLLFLAARRWAANSPSGTPAAGIRIHEGYGLTETSPVIAVNTPINHRIGTVGKILPNLEVRIAEDGEILVRGPSVFKGYWNRPEETKAALVDGWFKTGDIGNIDADGYLSVTDRKKDLIKTSGGKFIAPQPIENSLKLNPLVGVAAILGDKRKFPSVMISPNFAALEDWARENEIPFSSRAELIANPKVQALYEGIVEGINQNLARFEKLKRVLLVADEFTPDNGV